MTRHMSRRASTVSCEISGKSRRNRVSDLSAESIFPMYEWSNVRNQPLYVAFHESGV